MINWDTDTKKWKQKIWIFQFRSFFTLVLFEFDSLIFSMYNKKGYMVAYTPRIFKMVILMKKKLPKSKLNSFKFLIDELLIQHIQNLLLVNNLSNCKKNTFEYFRFPRKYLHNFILPLLLAVKVGKVFLLQYWNICMKRKRKSGWRTLR